MRIVHFASLAVAAAIAFSAFTSIANAKADSLLAAVGFGLTGTDSAQVEVVDRPNCVFRIGTETYHLNNVDKDRLLVSAYQLVSELNPVPQPYVRIELHGESTVYEVDTTTGVTRAEAEKILGPTAAAQEEARNPEAFLQHTSHSTSNQHTLTLPTAEEARVLRAWHYIYMHGCKGNGSPF